MLQEHNNKFSLELNFLDPSKEPVKFQGPIL